MKLIIDIPEDVYKPICDKYDTFPKEMKEWGLEAIKNGTPIPDNAGNDDTISREMALKECYEIVIDGGLYRVIQEETLLGLPPVTQKSGKWVVHEKPHGIRYLECPYCNIWYLNEHLIRNSYCPNCGAKMESEE